MLATYILVLLAFMAATGASYARHARRRQSTRTAVAAIDSSLINATQNAPQARDASPTSHCERKVRGVRENDAVAMQAALDTTALMVSKDLSRSSVRLLTPVAQRHALRRLGRSAL